MTARQIATFNARGEFTGFALAVGSTIVFPENGAQFELLSIRVADDFGDLERNRDIIITHARVGESNSEKIIRTLILPIHSTARPTKMGAHQLMF